MPSKTNTKHSPTLRRDTPLRPLIPARLGQGSIVRVVAPSGPFDRAQFQRGIAVLEAAGLKPVWFDDLFSQERYLAGTDARRLAELEAAMSDPGAAAIWFARGGYGATRLLPLIDRSLVRGRPKWLVGFSDATALHALWQLHGMVSLHGPNVTTLPTWSAEAQRALWDWLFLGHGAALCGRTVVGSGTVRGYVHGGNLTVLAAMAGTGFLPPAPGSILFIEDVGERPYRLDRMLTTLSQAGFFEGVVGVVVGQLTDCDEPAKDQAPGYEGRAVLCERLCELLPDRPIIADVPVGHAPSSEPLILGQRATLDADQATLQVDALSPP